MQNSFKNSLKSMKVICLNKTPTKNCLLKKIKKFDERHINKSNH